MDYDKNINTNKDNYCYEFKNSELTTDEALFVNFCDMMELSTHVLMYFRSSYEKSKNKKMLFDLVQFSIANNLDYDKIRILIGEYEVSGIDLRQYIKEYSIRQMVPIIKGLREKVDISKFLNPFFPEDAMQSILGKLLMEKNKNK